MVAVAVGVDDGLDGLVTSVRAVQRQGRARRLHVSERVDDDEPAVTLNEGDIGQRKTAHLVDTIGHAEQAVHRIEPGHAPQAGVHGVGRRLLVKKGVAGHGPGLPTAVGAVGGVGHGAYKAAPHVVKVTLVGKVQVLQRALLRGAGVGMGGFHARG